MPSTSSALMRESAVAAIMSHCSRRAAVCCTTDQLGLVAGPLREELGLGAGGLDRLDHLQAARRHAGQLARALPHPASEIGSHARGGAQEQEMPAIVTRPMHVSQGRGTP